MKALFHDMNPWLWSASGMMLALVCCFIVVFRGKVEDRLVGLEMSGMVLTLTLVLLTEGFYSTPLYDLPLTLSILALGSGLVFARFLKRWL